MSDDFTQCFGCGTWFVRGFDPDKAYCAICRRRMKMGDDITTVEGGAATSRVAAEYYALVQAMEDAKTPGELYVAYHSASPSAGIDHFGMPLGDIYGQKREAMMRDLGMDQKTFDAAARKEGLHIQVGPSAVCLHELVALARRQKATSDSGSLINGVSGLSLPFGREVILTAQPRKSRIPWLHGHNAAQVSLRAEVRQSIRVMVPDQPAHDFPIQATDLEGQARLLLTHSIELLTGQRQGIH